MFHKDSWEANDVDEQERQECLQEMAEDAAMDGEDELSGVAWCVNQPCDNRTGVPDSLCNDCFDYLVRAEGDLKK